MAGEHKGVQRRIRDEQPKAVYVHCRNLSLNLALQDAVSAVVSIRDVLSLTHDIVVFIRDSNTRIRVLEEIETDLLAEDHISLQPLCPTRWTIRTRALNALRVKYLTVISAMDELSNEPGPTGSKASGFATNSKHLKYILHY